MPTQRPVPIFLPPGFEQEVAAFKAFLAEVSDGADSPQATWDDRIAAHFQALWTLAGRDASLGLGQATPDHLAFRHALGPALLQSRHLSHCLEKPRGYAGDFEVMEHICDQVPISTNPLGRWLERWFFGRFPPYLSVRQRVLMLARTLRGEVGRGADHVLNVACGAAPELRMLGAGELPRRVDLVDQDAGALAHAVGRLAQVTGIDPPAGVTPYPHPIRALLSRPDILPGPYSMIYSMGLYDYLDRRTAVALTRALWQRLAPGGLLVVGNYHGHHWSRYVMEAVMDWFLIYRDPEVLLDLARDLGPVSDVHLVQDDTGLLQLLHVRKA